MSDDSHISAVLEGQDGLDITLKSLPGRTEAGHAIVRVLDADRHVLASVPVVWYPMTAVPASTSDTPKAPANP